MSLIRFPEKTGILKSRGFAACEALSIQQNMLAIKLHFSYVPSLHLEWWTLRIERDSHRETTRIHLIGRFQSEHIRELEKQFEECGPRFVLDLKEVTLVDVEVVRFLGACETDGMKIEHCSQYIREWIVRERGAHR